MRRGLPAFTRTTDPAWFESPEEGLSLVCRFHASPREQGSPSVAHVAFLRADAPHERLVAGARLNLFERSTRVASATWLAATALLLANGVIHENRMSILFMLIPFGSTLLTGALSNALDVQFIPDTIRKWWQTGLRDRLWNSRAGEWFARKLGAPERSTAIGGGVFRATKR